MPNALEPMDVLWIKCSNPGIVPPFPCRQAMFAPGQSTDPEAWLERAIKEGPAYGYRACVVEVGASGHEDGVRLIEALRRFAAHDIAVCAFDRDRSQADIWIASGADCVVADVSELEKLGLADDTGHEPAHDRSAKPLIGMSASMRQVASSVRLVAQKGCTVLIEGETGTGKEVVARQIHSLSRCARGPWVAVNCGAIPENLLEAELFGYVKGAFTGASGSRTGKFEAANRGTIFLDEIGEMPLAVQAKLLRVLQEREVERLGSNERIPLDVRVIAATNRSLPDLIRQGRFRQDLYYRLNVFRIVVPALRERMSDIGALARHFVSRLCRMEKSETRRIAPSALRALISHDWPGNVRELENAIERALVLCSSREMIEADDLALEDPRTGLLPEAANQGPIPIAENFRSRSAGVQEPLLPTGGIDYQEALEAFELSLLRQAIVRTRGNKTAAADLLRLKRTTLSARLRTLEGRPSSVAA